MTLELLPFTVLLYNPLRLRVEHSHLVLEMLAGSQSLSRRMQTTPGAPRRSPIQAMTTQKIKVV